MLSVSVGSVPAIVSFLFKEQHEWSWKFYVTPLYWEKQTVSLAVGVIIVLDILIAVGEKKKKRGGGGTGASGSVARDLDLSVPAAVLICTIFSSHSPGLAWELGTAEPGGPGKDFEWSSVTYTAGRNGS